MAKQFVRHHIIIIPSTSILNGTRKGLSVFYLLWIPECCFCNNTTSNKIWTFQFWKFWNQVSNATFFCPSLIANGCCRMCLIFTLWNNDEGIQYYIYLASYTPKSITSISWISNESSLVPSPGGVATKDSNCHVMDSSMTVHFRGGDSEYEALLEWRLEGENLSHWRETCPTATLFTTSPTQTTGIWGEKPASF